MAVHAALVVADPDPASSWSALETVHRRAS
jgi:hypothetical protein